MISFEKFLIWLENSSKKLSKMECCEIKGKIRTSTLSASLVTTGVQLTPK
jgi:hypothetical protein